MGGVERRIFTRMSTPHFVRVAQRWGGGGVQWDGQACREKSRRGVAAFVGGKF